MTSATSQPPIAAGTVPSGLPVSVIMPTRNPRLDVIKMTLDALRAQTLPLEQWELVLVDNASDPPLATLVDVSWHPNARILIESKPGTLGARSLAMRQSRGQLIVNVDDDNILAPDYLVNAIALGEEEPQLGVWGGRIHPDYEGTPPAWIADFSHHLAICEFDQPSWSSFVDDRSVPYGASMCVRRAVVTRFLERFDTEDIARYGRTYSGPNGSKMTGVSAEDQLLSYTATMMGYGLGRFPRLQMHHRIDRKRYDPDHFLRTVRGNAHGALLIQLYHGNCPRYRMVLFWPVLKYFNALIKRRGMNGRILRAEARGEIDALLEHRRSGAVAPDPLAGGREPAGRWNNPAAPPPPPFSPATKHER